MPKPIYTPKQAVTCILFSLDDTEVLLIKRRDIPVWVLPGGGIDPGETPEQAALREMEEETGLQVTLKRKIAEYLPVNRLTQKTHFFECTLISGTPSRGLETADIQFFPLSRLPKLLPPPYSGWISDARIKSSSMISKPISGVSYLVFVKLLLLHPILTGRFILSKMGIHLNKPLAYTQEI